MLRLYSYVRICIKSIMVLRKELLGSSDVNVKQF